MKDHDLNNVKLVGEHIPVPSSGGDCGGCLWL